MDVVMSNGGNGNSSTNNGINNGGNLNNTNLTINYDNDFDINQYVNNALYSLVKNDQ